MRKIAALTLIALLLLSASCLAQERIVGILQGESSASQHYQHMLENHPDLANHGAEEDFILYDSLTTLLLGLKSGDVVEGLLPDCTARYIDHRNEDVVAAPLPDSSQQIAYSMMLREEDAELYDKLNQAIIDIQTDGTLGILVEEQLRAFIETDPTPASLPYIEGAPTVKVVLTGDLPPMDFVSADGQPAGFNVALLSEIANRIQVNFEPVMATAGSRIQALASGRADLVFWSNNSYCDEHEYTSAAPIEGAVITEPYWIDSICHIFMNR